uniref:Si:dkey-193c22.2 n=1 Tax=Neogobius melanostomus TaxID=47308 RepID=A0A8C6V449_9GOBI
MTELVCFKGSVSTVLDVCCNDNFIKASFKIKINPFLPAASFYGDGYVQLRAKESMDHNTLRIRFRTSRTSGLLFVAAGHRDYFLLELHAGRLQLKLDVGSGEHVLQSEKGSQLNDLAWHSVEIIHIQHNVTLAVDKNSHSSLTMAGSIHQLNIVDGLYVGGSGALNRPYLHKDLIGFRGCMEEVVFNEHDLLSSLRPYTGLKTVYEVSLGCSPQFFATEEDPISFFSSRAYISLPPLDSPKETVFECVVHTSAKEGILLYNSGRDGDFVAVEIRDGLLVALVGKDGTKTELRSVTIINDRKWHTVKLQFNSRSLELNVDGKFVKNSINSSSKELQLTGYFFVGGTDDSIRLEARKTALASLSGKRVKGGSFKGCLRNIVVNGLKMGLSTAVVTKDISVGCEPEKEPEQATTVSPISFSSSVDFVTPTPSLHMSTLAKGLDRKYGAHFVHLRNLVVPEGGRASLEAKHVKVLLDFKALGIRQSQIMFRIQEQPLRGQIRLDVDPEQEENTFSMLDLWHERVMYIHGGSEEPDDFFFFSIYSSSRKPVPDYLKNNKWYRYNISVTPTNDAPELSLPGGNLFVLLENSKKRLTTDVLKATDIDSPGSDMAFSVLGNLNADAGYLELENNPGTAVTSFTYTDLEELRVYYVHAGVRNSRIVFRVSDGEKVSNTVVLRVLAVALEYKISNNTGLELTQGEWAIISSSHLAVQTNAVKQVVDVRYDVIELPQYGELQRLHSSGEWRPTDSFSQRLLEKERLRYVSTYQDIQTSNTSDYFKCKVNVAARANTELLFPITVKWVRYMLVRNVIIGLDKVRKVTLTSENLFATAHGVDLPEDDLYYRVLTTPKKGKLLLDTTVLAKNTSFSQRNVTEQKVHYELVDRPYEDTSDRFKFLLFSKHAQSQNYDFQFSIKADVNNVFIKNEGLSLLEGESKLLTKDELFAETLSSTVMHYTVINSPQHGKLARISQSNSNESYTNILTFSNQDIMDKRLMYIHDDSETTGDTFTFIASTSYGFKSSIAEDEVGSKIGTFNISIQLVNDQKPVRVIDQVFHVVRDGQKLLTADDLRYHDADADFDDGDLLYTRRGIPMGDLVLVNDTTYRLFQFHQRDLEEKRVLFIHKGVSTGRFVLFVSDGKHFVSSLLDISAHDPFLKVGNNSSLLVQKGKSVSISTSNFSVMYNLDIRDDQELMFIVTEAPKSGAVYCKGEKVTSFTQLDLKAGYLSYHHNDSTYLADCFNLTVKAKGLQLSAKINVKVYLESHQFVTFPPLLQVTHEDNLPSEIVFTVRESPTHGFLRRFVEAEERYIGTRQSPVRTFSQADIYNGDIQYVQVDPDTLNDTFSLDVTNGVTDVRGIRVSIDIIPRLIPLQVSNFTLEEGASKALTQEILKVTNQHFSGINFLYSLTQPPLHGHIEHSRHPGVVEHEYIYYVHDSSETLDDNFTVVANDTGLRKQSAAQAVHIQVIAVNDETPVITANRVLRVSLLFHKTGVWVSSVTEIRPEDLRAHDLDSPSDELHFMVTPPSNGHLTLKSAPMRPVLNFTQAHIDQGKLLFVHKGAMSGGFNFQVNDGVNFTPRQIFSITARALVIIMERNRPLKVFPGSSTPITSENLQAVTNDISDSSNRTVTFGVTRHPKLGRLVLKQPDDSMVDISTFTQDMVDMKYCISLYVDFTPYVSVLINKSSLDASNLLSKLPVPERSAFDVWYQVTSLPQHGVIVVGERNLTKEKPNFSQFIINKYGITYKHDNSETARDHFVFSAWLNPKGRPAQRPSDDAVIEESFNIAIAPVNDQPPVLKTKAPTLKVVQGDTVALGPENLKVEDLDNAPDDIQFTVISKPNNGYLALRESLNEPVASFTQAQVNNGDILFIHDGGAASGVFYFSVTDGHHKPIYKLFNLEVTKIALSLVNHSELSLQQDKTSVPLTQDNLYAKTNGKNTTIHYQITEPPSFGKILKDNQEATQFEQTDLQMGRLSYHMISHSSGEDSFKFIVFTTEANLTDQVLNISVQPLIQISQSVMIPNGVPVKLNPSFLNASQLASISESIPVFEVVSLPTNGKLVRMEPAKSKKNLPAQSFTFEELKQGKIALELSANMTGVQEVNDSLVFVLKADNLPPAKGEFHFTIVPYDPALLPTTMSPAVTTASPRQTAVQTLKNGTTLLVATTAYPSTHEPSKNQQKYHKGRSRWGSSNRTSILGTTLGKHETEEEIPLRNTPVRVESYPQKSPNPLLVILPLLALLLLVIIFVVLVVYLRHHRQRNPKSATPAEPGPLNLSNSQSYSSPTVPTVTVTPLHPGSCPSSPVLERFLTHHHPISNYSAIDSSMFISTWSNDSPAASTQTISVATPTLRKNQYWV